MEAVLGQGGCGIVHRAFDVQLQRPVAIKQLVPPYQPEDLQRFRREAESLRALQHPNVIPILAVEPGPPPLLVMPLVDGGSLHDELRRGPFAIERVIELGQTLAEALSFVHSRNVVHRDLKPANVLVHEGRPLLADFGLARGPRGHTITATGDVLGTPGYLAPEQAAGGEIGPWTDVYGLGALLYALVTGHPPFRAESALAALQQVVKSTPQPVRALRPEAPVWLEAVIQRCLAKDPRQRYATALELADALLPPGATKSAPNRGLILGWAAAGLAVAAAVAAVAWPQGEAPQTSNTTEPPPVAIDGPSDGPIDEPSDPTPPPRPLDPLPPEPGPGTPIPTWSALGLTPPQPSSWLGSLPPAKEVRGGAWPGPEWFEYWNRHLAQGNGDPLREALEQCFPAAANDPQQAFAAAEVMRCLDLDPGELGYLTRFVDRDWACARRVAQLGKLDLGNLDPERYGVSALEAEADVILARCLGAVANGAAQPKPGLRSLNPRELSRRQRVEWAIGVLSVGGHSPGELTALLADVDALLRDPQSMSLAVRLDLLQARLYALNTMPEDEVGRSNADSRVATALRVLQFRPTHVAALGDLATALVELGRNKRGLVLAAALIEFDTRPMIQFLSATLLCECVLRDDEARKGVQRSFLTRALEIAYGPHAPEKSQWPKFSPLLNAAHSPETHERLVNLVRRARDYAGPDQEVLLLMSEAHLEGFLRGADAGLEVLRASWPGTPEQLPTFEYDLKLVCALQKSQQDGTHFPELWAALVELDASPFAQTPAGLLLLTRYHADAGLRSLAREYAHQLQTHPARNGRFSAQLARLRDQLGSAPPAPRLPAALPAPTPAELLPLVAALPAPAAKGVASTPAEVTQWQRQILAQRYVPTRRELFARYGSGSPEEAGALSEALRRLELGRWDQVVCQLRQADAPRLATRLAVLIGATSTPFVTDGVNDPGQRANLQIGRAEWLERTARTTNTLRTDPRLADELSSAFKAMRRLDPQPLDPGRYADWLVVRARLVLLSNEISVLEDAVETLDAELERIPPTAFDGAPVERVLHQRGQLLLALQRNDEAAASFLRCLEWNAAAPHHATALATAFAEGERHAEALAVCSWLLEATPDSNYAHHAAYIACLVLQREPELADRLPLRMPQLIELANMHARAQPPFAVAGDVYLRLCQVVRDQGNWTLLGDLAQRFAQRDLAHPASPRTFTALSILGLSGEAAYRDYLATLEAGEVRVGVEASVASWRFGQDPARRDELQAAIEDAARFADSSLYLGLIAIQGWIELDEYDRARESLAAARRLYPNAARVRLELDNFERALERLEADR